MSNNSNKSKILYVDDEKGNLNVFQKLFRREYQVVTCQSAEEGLTRFKAEYFDLVISDQRMPDKTGVQFIEDIRKINKVVPCILLSGYKDFDVMRFAVNEVGVNKIVSKPFDHKSLQNTIDLAITTHHLQLENLSIHEKLIESEKKYRDIFESISDVLIRTDTRGKVILVSPSIKDLAGFKPEEIIEQPIERILIDFNLNDATKKLIRKNTSPMQIFSIMYGKNKKVLHVSSTAIRLVDEHSSKVTGYQFLIRDITEQYKLQNEILRSREDFRLLSENSTSRIYKVNRDLKIEYANKLALESFDGFKPNKIDFLSLIDKENRNDIHQDLNWVFENGSLKSLEIENESADEMSWFAIDMVPLHINEGLDSVLIIVNDITIKKRVEGMLLDINQELEEEVKKRTLDLEKAKSDLEIAYAQEKNLNKLRSQFVSTASHQFRTPLTVIQSNIGLLELQLNKFNPDLLEIYHKISKRINSEIKRMTDLMDNVLILGKRDSGGLKVKSQMIDVLKLCTTVVNQYNQIQPDNRKASISHKGSPVLFYMDPDLLDNALSNLISNAFKYSQGNPAPEVFLEYTKTSLRISIRDFGIGIPEKDIPNLFEPFYRGSNVREFLGTGLGTAIVKTYVELLGGRISLKSKINEGTTFTIRFKK